MLPILESATQITGMAAAIRSKREFRFIVYDSACMLAHFVRNKARKMHASALDILAACTFVLDRFHSRNHKACLDPGH